MIPRVRPSYSVAELLAAVRPGRDAVERFEQELADYFQARHALVFPYGRSAVYCCLRALSPSGREVVQPAYNCVVVAHATVAAGCRPVFVDAQRQSPNQDPEAMAEQVGPGVAAVIPTSMFGFTFDAGALCAAIRRRNPQALILLDCCQCFDARWHGERLTAQGDAALLAFGIGKPMTTLFGGALVTDRDDLADAVRRFRDVTFRNRTWPLVARRWVYFAASWAAFCRPAVRLTDVIENGNTPLHRYLVQLRAREAIRLPADNEVFMTPMEAAVGRVQLRRVAQFLERRQQIASVYAHQLRDLPGFDLLTWPDGSSYAIYAARVAKPELRPRMLAAMRRHGVQGDTTLSYVVPGLECYRAHGYGEESFPNATVWARSVINLPNHPTLDDRQVHRVVDAVQNALRAACTAPGDVRDELGAASLRIK